MAAVTVCAFDANARVVVHKARHATLAAALQYLAHEHGMSPCRCPDANDFDESELTRLARKLCDVHGSLHARFFTWTVVDDTGEELTYDVVSASLH